MRYKFFLCKLAFFAFTVAAQCASNSLKAQLRHIAFLVYKLRFAFAANIFKVARSPCFQVT
jgi:hypothetical protein